MRKKLFHRIMDQSGRSLSEMLGVLAVIGVLTLMGVYGFSYAMEKWRENETFDRYSKVVAGARTSRILENEGYWTLWKRDEANPDVHEKRDAYMPQQISMNQVISNIGDDLQTEFIYAPLKGPYNMFNKPTDGSDWTEDQEQEVEIWVKVQNPQAFTVHAINLTKEACKRIVRANLGYSWAYGESGATSYDETPKKTDCGDGAGWCEYAEVNTDVAEQLCQNTVDGDDLVLWFGPYCDTIDSCSSSDKCDSGNPKPECYYPEKPCKTGEFCSDGCCYEGGTDEECDSGEACDEYGMCSGDLECGDDGCCHDPKKPTPGCNEANACYIDGDTPVCCGDGERCYPDAQLCCTKDDACYIDDDSLPVCCVNGEECDEANSACVWSGEVCDSGNPKPECSSNEECSSGICVDGCCGCLGGAPSCSSNEECSSGICNNGCCEPEQTDPEDVCDSGNPKPECGEDASCGEGYYCDIEGCCEKLPDCDKDNNEELYCISDSQASVAERCNASYCMYATRCVKWGCSTTELLQDGTKAASIASGYDDKPGWRGSDSRGRDREILMEGSLSGKYPYCSLRLKIEGDDRCVVVSYCDEEPVESRYVGYAGGAYAKEMCPACEASYNPEKAVCVGHELKSLSEAVDGVDFLKHFYGVTDGGKCLEADTCKTNEECAEGYSCQAGCCKAIGGQCAEDSLQCETDADCTEWAAENPPEGTTDDALVIGKCVNGCCAASCMDECAVKGESYWNNNGKLDCCPAGQAWYNCGSCVTNPIVKDACNVDRIEAKACCAGPSNAPAGCTDTGQWNGKNKANTAVGDRMPSCYTNYPDSNQQCCDMACLADGGGNSGYDTVCCDANKGDVIQGGVCCKAGSAPQSALCCNAMGGTWAPTDAYSPDESGLDGTCCMSPNVAYVKWGTGAHGVTCESCPGGGVSKVHPANGNTSGPQPMTTKYPLNAPVKIETIEGIMCCNGDLPFYDGNTAACCPVGQLVEDKSGKKEPFTNGKCCQTIGDTPYLDTNGKGDCCPNGRKVSPLASSSSSIVEGQCCATGEEPYGDAQCCSSGQVAKGATVASDKCCGQNEKASQSTSGGDGQCCPVGEEPYGDAQCCPAAQLAGTSGIQQCCPVGKTPYTDANGDGVCCEAGEIWDDTQQQCVAVCENGTIMECPSDEEVSTSGGTGMGCVKLNMVQVDPETGVEKEMCCCSGGEPSEETTTPETTTPETTTPETTTPETTTPETTTPETTTPETTTPETTTPETTTPETTTPETTTPETTTPGDIIPDTTTPGGIILDTTTPETTTPETTTPETTTPGTTTTTPGDIIPDTTTPDTTTPETTTPETTTPGTTTTTPGDIIPDTTTPGTITTTTTTETTVTETTTPGGVTPGETSTTTTATETTVTETTTPEGVTPGETSTTTTPRWWENNDVTIETDISDPYALETESYSW